MNQRFASATFLLLAASLQAAVGQHADMDSKDLVAKAVELAKAQKYDQAIALMKKAVQVEPGNDAYLGVISDFEYQAGKYADGLAHALDAIKLNGKVGAYYVLAAGHAFWEQDLEQARTFCDLVLKRGKEFGPAAVQNVQIIEDQLGKKKFTLLYNLDPKKGRMANGAFAIAMPRDGLPYQSVTYEISGVKSHKLIKGDVDDVLQVVPLGSKPFPLTITITTQAHSFKKELAKAAAMPLPADARAHLGSIVTVDPRSSTLQKVAATVKGDDALATVRNILAWQQKNIAYKLEKESITDLDFKSVDEIVKRGSAECRGHALLFIALCRACDIPARPIWGIVRLPPGADRKFGDIVSHNWAEVYVSGAGWVPVDPRRTATLGFLPNYYMRMSMDAQKSKTSTENVPQHNLMYMHSAKLRYEESR